MRTSYQLGCLLNAFLHFKMKMNQVLLNLLNYSAPCHTRLALRFKRSA